MTDRDRSSGISVRRSEEAKAEPRCPRRVTAVTQAPVCSDGDGAAGSPSPRRIEQLCIDTIRTLSMDAVQKAKSGHPGTPMALAPLVYTLWQRFLAFDPEDPTWLNRDRFVLSNG